MALKCAPVGLSFVKKNYMPKHLQTIKHAREMQGRDYIEVVDVTVDHRRYKPRH
jgi:hypothetical protein